MTFRPLAAACALAAGLAATPAFAEAPPPCRGVDMIAKLKAEEPGKYAAFETAAQSVPNAEGLLWKVEATGVAPSWLFGTMHTTEADLVALAPAIRAALAGATSVAVEIADAGGAAQQAEMIAYVTSKGIDLAGVGLDGLTPEQQAEARRRLEEAGMPAQVATVLKPWFLALTLQVSACQTRQLAAGLPTIDAAVEKAGRDGGAAIVGLESVTEQLDAASRIPDEVARRMIRETVSRPGAADDVQATTLGLYRARHVGWYYAMKGETFGQAFDAASYADFLTGVVDERNRLMADRARPLIEKGGAVVAVGALHLPGDRGLVALIRGQGFSVTRIW